MKHALSPEKEREGFLLLAPANASCLDSVTDVMRREFAAHCPTAHVLTHAFALALGSMQGGRVRSRGGRRNQNLALYLGNIPKICKRDINMHLVGKRCLRT